MDNIIIREAIVEDCDLILRFITDLAIYEKAEHEVVASVQDLENTLFSDDATAKALICMLDEKPAGFAVYFYNYSTWLGKNGLYLEDLYVDPSCRSHGIGKALLHHLAEIAVDKKCGRFEWSVLDWNQPAIDFYESYGAKPLSEWVGYRLEGNALTTFAKKKGS